MGKDRDYKPRSEFNDGIDRRNKTIYVRLSKNQDEQLKPLADAAGKNLEHYLRDILQAALDAMVPATKPSTPS